MRKLVLRRLALTSVFIVAFSGCVQAEEKAPTEASVLRLLEVTGAADMGAQMLDMMMAQFKTMAPEVPEAFWSEFRNEVDLDEMNALLVPIYQKHLSAEDVEAALSFFGTAAGKRFIEKQPTMMQEAQLAGQAWGQQVAMRAFERMSAADQ